MQNKQNPDQLSETETKRRAEAALKKMLATAPAPRTVKPKRKPSPKARATRAAKASG